jgi:nucleotide-binding universal stress UspA family protein
LIAIDNGPSAEQIALSGLQLAEQYHAEIALVSVVRESIVNNEEISPNEMADIIERNMISSQQNVIDKVFKNYPVKTFVEQGSASEAIVRIADRWSANLIVMGTHGRKGLSHLLMGSVAEEVIRHSKQTVVVIPVAEEKKV